MISLGWLKALEGSQSGDPTLVRKTRGSEMAVTTIRAKAFLGESIKVHKVAVDANGVVRVWDSVAGYYTTCHCLSKSAIAKARKATR